MSLTLIIGNKNYSSWSLRPWLAMKVAGLPFAEIVVPLDDDFKRNIQRYSPAGQVPVLYDGDTIVWDSLAILEYLAEKFPGAGLWPQEQAVRSQARCVAAEMHSGFVPLRRACPMNMRRTPKTIMLEEGVRANIARIDAIWSGCRARFGKNGPFLFGHFTIADAMYAPIVSRFATYAIPVGPEAWSYMNTLRDLPAWTEWDTAARAEALDHAAQRVVMGARGAVAQLLIHA